MMTPTEGAVRAGSLNLKLMFLIILLLALESCQGSGRFETPQILVSKGTTVV
jgi:hypothetical protein